MTLAVGSISAVEHNAKATGLDFFKIREVLLQPRSTASSANDKDYTVRCHGDRKRLDTTDEGPGIHNDDIKLLTKLSAERAKVVLADRLGAEGRIEAGRKDTEVRDRQAADMPIEAAIPKHFLETAVSDHAHLLAEARADKIAIDQDCPVTCRGI